VVRANDDNQLSFYWPFAQWKIIEQALQSLFLDILKRGNSHFENQYFDMQFFWCNFRF